MRLVSHLQMFVLWKFENCFEMARMSDDEIFFSHGDDKHLPAARYIQIAIRGLHAPEREQAESLDEGLPPFVGSWDLRTRAWKLHRHPVPHCTREMVIQVADPPPL